MHFMQSIFGTACLSVALVSATACSHDNCLRALENARRTGPASSLCASVLATSLPPAATTAFPGFIANCGTTSLVSRVSSACSCFLASASSTKSSASTSLSAPPSTSLRSSPATSSPASSACHVSTAISISISTFTYTRNVTVTETTTVSASATPSGPPCDVLVNGGFETGDLTGWSAHKHAGGADIGLDETGQVLPVEALEGKYTWWSPANAFAGVQQTFTPCAASGSSAKPSRFVVGSYRAQEGFGVCTFRLCYISDVGVDDPERNCSPTWQDLVKRTDWQMVAVEIPFVTARPGDYTVYFESHCDGDDQVLVDGLRLQ